MMKLLLVVFLTGLALSVAVPLPTHELDLKEAEEFQNRITYALQAEDDTDEEIKKNLREHLDELLEKIKDAIDHGKSVKEDYIKKFKQLKQTLKEMKEDLSDHAKELIEKIKQKGKDYLKKILERLGLGKRSIEMHTEMFMDQLADEEVSSIDQLKERLAEIMKKIKDAIDSGKSFQDFLTKFRELSEKIKKKHDELGDDVKERLEKIKEKVREYFRKLLEKMEPQERRAIVQSAENTIKDSYRFKDIEKRSFREYYEKIKQYLKDFHIELKEKFVNFGEWAKEQYEKGLAKGKDRIENLRELARKFVKDAKYISKDVAEQAKGFFEEYKDDLGTVYNDLRHKLKEILQQKD